MARVLASAAVVKRDGAAAGVGRAASVGRPTTISRGMLSEIDRIARLLFKLATVQVLSGQAIAKNLYSFARELSDVWMKPALGRRQDDGCWELRSF